ncbi:MAG: HAD family hydrolase [Candidatus Bathyarchaeia archaeon]|jgi:putative hydrolase of the HAD superfamily
MAGIKTVIFDYVGTLVNCKGYSMEASRQKLYRALVNEGFNAEEDRFVQAYTLAHEKYRKVRYERLREVTNAVWVAEALSNLGFQVTRDDDRVKAALNIFFQDFIDSLELRKDAKKLIKKAQAKCKVGLITNFTYAPVIYKSLRHLGINLFFNAIVVSDENGWRKPSSHIFQESLKKLKAQANEAIYIGDTPIEDIKGAKEAGLKTVFVPSQFNTLKDLSDSQQKPDYITKDLSSVLELLNEITN